jgi:hypothetical protein
VIEWRVLIDAALTLAGILCIGIAAMFAAASRKAPAFTTSMDLERGAFAFGVIGLVCLVLGSVAEVL